MYSIKMRASKKAHPKGEIFEAEEHISGGERLVLAEELSNYMHYFLCRALNHSLGSPDSINFKIIKVDPSRIIKIKSLPIYTLDVRDVNDGICSAKKILRKLNLKEEAIQQAINWVTNGGAPGNKNMRGAILFDAFNLQRLEDDQNAGIRATNMDMTKEAEDELTDMLKNEGNHNPRTRDAITIASKICNYPGVIAELCCSDDCDYTGGYVASKKLGYVRINHLKNYGHGVGGRVIFLDTVSCNIEDYKKYLKDTLILITEISKTRHYDPALEFQTT